VPARDLTVCHVTSVHVPTDARVLYHECRSVARRWRTVLVCRDDSGPRVLEGVEIQPLPKRAGRLSRFAGSREIVSAAESTKAALYHFHDPELLPAMASLAKRTGTPVVYDAHEHYPDAMDQKAWIPPMLRPAAAWWAERIERTHVPAMSAVVAADAALKQRFDEMHPLVVELDNYPPLGLFGEPLTRPVGPPVLVYVGSVSVVRGFFDMVETLRIVRERHPDARLEVYGRPTEEVARALSAFLESLPEGSVVMHGPEPYGRIREMLSGASIGLSLLQDHPKYEKNVSMKVFDYMAAGLPYVASDFPPLRAATHGVGGRLVRPGSPQAAAEAVLDLLDSGGTWGWTAGEGRALVESSLNWESMEPRLFGLYEQLLG
jgi:glycosyltransferase involved in cell wall biosynthesis